MLNSKLDNTRQTKSDQESSHTFAALLGLCVLITFKEKENQECRYIFTL